jgi:hypothetical protein
VQWIIKDRGIKKDRTKQRGKEERITETIIKKQVKGNKTSG